MGVLADVARNKENERLANEYKKRMELDNIEGLKKSSYEQGMMDVYNEVQRKLAMREQAMAEQRAMQNAYRPATSLYNNPAPRQNAMSYYEDNATTNDALKRAVQEYLQA